jgi:hypothetical protein
MLYLGTNNFTGVINKVLGIIRKRIRICPIEGPQAAKSLQ